MPEWFDEANGYAKNSQSGELYNLKEDLAQKKNVFAEQPEKVAELRSMLNKLRNKGQVR